MGGKNKIPDDIELFRREMGDVRPLKSNRIVPSQTPRTYRKHEPTTKKSPVTVKKGPLYKGPCLGSPNKKVYDTIDEAIRAAQYVRQEWRSPVRPYQCKFCGKYHLTSKQA